jgi:predicted transcriptional regulator
MAANIIHVSDDLLAQLRKEAQAEGKTVDQLAEEALRRGLEDRKWQELVEYGEGRGRALGFKEEDAGDVVQEWRKEQPR